MSKRARKGFTCSDRRARPDTSFQGPKSLFTPRASFYPSCPHPLGPNATKKTPKTVQGQERYFDNKSSQPAAVADKKQQEVKVGSKSYEARAKKFDTKVPGATPFQDKLKEYELKAPTVGMFGEISKDGESILEIAAWKRADEYCTFFAPKPQVALSRIKQQMHREVGHSSMLQIVRNIRDNMEFLELPGGGTHQPSSETRHSGRAQVDEVEDDLVSFRDPGHRAGPGGLD